MLVLYLTLTTMIVLYLYNAINDCQRQEISICSSVSHTEKSKLVAWLWDTWVSIINTLTVSMTASAIHGTFTRSKHSLVNTCVTPPARGQLKGVKKTSIYVAKPHTNGHVEHLLVPAPSPLLVDMLNRCSQGCRGQNESTWWRCSRILMIMSAPPFIKRTSPVIIAGRPYILCPTWYQLISGGIRFSSSIAPNENFYYFTKRFWWPDERYTYIW